MALNAETIPSQQVHVLIALVLLTLPISWLLGRGPERMIATAMTVVIALDLLCQKLAPFWTGTSALRPDQAVLDGVLLLGIGAVALRANRIYPLIMAGAALIAVIAHALRWIELFDGRFSYLVLITAPAYVMMAAFWSGLILHIRRERRFGSYADWRGSPALSARTPQTNSAASGMG